MNGGLVAALARGRTATREARGDQTDPAMGRVPASRQLTLSSLAVAASAALMAPAAGAALPTSPEPGERVERAVRSQAPDADRVRESYVRVYEPLPEAAGPHPDRCDWVGYLRFRSSDGPERSADADAVLVSMPGILAGASMHDQLGRNVVRLGAGRDMDIEYWALDRRSNCLEDRWGVTRGAKAGEAGLAFDYYYGGEEVDGRRFGGFKSAQEAAFLSEVGLEQTLVDWRAVITDGIPSRKRRARILLCGGHSLGGPLTAAFAGWDFDGDAESTDDAGYRQCAGFFGLDTSLELSGGEGGVGVAAALAEASAASPYLNAPPFTPETSQILGPFGVAAFQEPDAESELVDRLPRTPAFELSNRLLFARNAAEFASGSPSTRDFHVTNEVALAGIWDDNSVPITIMRTSFGTFDGGPIVPKDFPTPSDASAFPGADAAPLVNNSFLTAPETPEGPLYEWRSYDGVGEDPALDESGRAYTNAASEVSDLHQAARAHFEAPADYAEQYFPTRLAVDVFAAEAGDRSGGLENLRHDGVSRRPSLLVQAGDSATNTGGELEAGREWEREGIGGELTLAGYNHIDVVSAAFRQHDGRPEGASQALMRFAAKAVRPPRAP
jgi:hypothetical protein